MKKLLVFLLSLCFFLPLVDAKTNETKFVNAYLFHSSSCSHCEALIGWFDDYLKENDKVKLYKYEVSHNKENMQKYIEVKKLLNNDSNGVPFLVIGEDVIIGFGSSTDEQIVNLINKYLNKDYDDVVGNYLGLKVYEGVKDNNIDKNDEEEKNENIEYEAPIIGKFNAKSVSLPLLSIILGFVDGFNPCAMWILIFLITMLFNMQDKKKMWILGLTFITVSGFVYLLFMVSWLNLAVFMSSVTFIRVMISIFAMVFGIYNIYNFIKSKNDMVGCNVTNEKSRNKIMNNIRVILSQKKFLFSIIGIMLLAVSVNVLELLCSLGLPVIFTQVLALNNLTTIEYSIYILLYILFFLIDDIVIFLIAMKTLEIKGISNKYTKYSHLIGGLVMLLIGILMLLKPEWLMFNF